MNLSRLAAVALAGASLLGLAAPAALASQSRVSQVEVAFVLDTTGSMEMLIDGAKKKIWSIADEIRRARPDAEIRFAIIGYRDRGDVYVTDVTDLTDDLHAVYGKLVGFRAEGGGDTPESVNEALNTAVARLDWTGGDEVRRIVFLVGDAPPHMDYAQDVPFTASMKLAKAEGIVVNTVQAGTDMDTEVAWRAIAELGGGRYMAIPQSGNVAVIETPFDQQIQRLQLELNETVVPYGNSVRQAEVRSKMDGKAAAPAPAASDMASYENRAEEPGKRKVVTGEGDLVADVASGSLSLDDASRIAPAELPEGFADLDKETLKARIGALQEKRTELQSEIETLVKERDAYLLKAETTEGEEDSFDGAVKDAIASQL